MPETARVLDEFAKNLDLATELAKIDELTFGEDGWDATYILGLLTLSDSTAIVLYDEKNTPIGYTVAVSSQRAYEGELEYENRDFGPEIAYVSNTVIHPEHQGKGLVGALMDKLEDALRGKGYTYLDRDSAVENGYAAKVERHYGDRVVTQAKAQESEYGSQRYFRIAL